MDKTTLVNIDQEIEGLIVEALSRKKIPVTALDWTAVPQFEAGQLVVVTSLYDSKGPRETYRRIFAALEAARVYEKAPIKEVFVMSPEDSLAKELVRQLKAITEGSIHILRTNGNHRSSYSVVFTPYLGTGGAIHPAFCCKRCFKSTRFEGQRLYSKRASQSQTDQKARTRSIVP
jgi:hypothetical protein